MISGGTEAESRRTAGGATGGACDTAGGTPGGNERGGVASEYCNFGQTETTRAQLVCPNRRVTPLARLAL